MFYFKEEISGWDSWGKVFCSTEAFQGLALAIFNKESILIKDGIKNLTPGSNAVFRSDDYVIKIYAPKESGFDTEGDFRTERTVMEYAQKAGASLPKVLAYGNFKDKYLFRYLIMEFIKGKEANEILPEYSSAQKQEVVRQLKRFLKKLNTAADIGSVKIINKRYRETNRKVLNQRMEGLPLKLIQELNHLAEKESFANCVLVHGDITGENVLISPKGELKVIDFADCSLAPDYYELAPILFELFKWDKELVQAYKGEEAQSEFLDKVIKSLAIHDFCGNIIKDYCSRNHIMYEEIQSINDLKNKLSEPSFFLEK